MAKSYADLRIVEALHRSGAIVPGIAPRTRCLSNGFTLRADFADTR